MASIQQRVLAAQIALDKAMYEIAATKHALHADPFHSPTNRLFRAREAIKKAEQALL